MGEGVGLGVFAGELEVDLDGLEWVELLEAERFFDFVLGDGVGLDEVGVLFLLGIEVGDGGAYDTGEETADLLDGEDGLGGGVCADGGEVGFDVGLLLEALAGGGGGGGGAFVAGGEVGGAGRVSE